MTTTKYKRLEVLAIIILIFGVILFVMPFLFSEIKFNLSGNIASIENLGNLGSYLSGTSGILLTLAGIIFIYISLKISFDAMTEQRIESINQAKLQSVRDFENLFIFLCNEIDNIKENYPDGIELYNKEIKRLFKRFSYDKEEQMQEYIDNGDLNIQVREEKIHLNFDSLILHISFIINQVESQVPFEYTDLKPNYFRILSNKLNKEELRLLQVVLNTDLFDVKVNESLKKLSYRYYERSEEQSQRKRDESKRSYEAIMKLRNIGGL